MAHIVVSPQAEDDTVAMARYLVERSQSRAVGEQFIRAMEEKLTLLARHPGSGRLRHDLQPGVRSVPMFGSCLIFYRPFHDGIEVLRVVHSSRDLEEVFRAAVS